MYEAYMVGLGFVVQISVVEDRARVWKVVHNTSVVGACRSYRVWQHPPALTLNPKP